MTKISKVYQLVEEKIISRLEDAITNGGLAPWSKSWIGGTKNFITKREYRGINLLLLDPGQYITFKQIQALQKKNTDVKLKKGVKSEMVDRYILGKNGYLPNF